MDNDTTGGFGDFGGSVEALAGGQDFGNDRGSGQGVGNNGNGNDAGSIAGANSAFGVAIGAHSTGAPETMSFTTTADVAAVAGAATIIAGAGLVKGTQQAAFALAGLTQAGPVQTGLGNILHDIVNGLGTYGGFAAAGLYSTSVTQNAVFDMIDAFSTGQVAYIDDAGYWGAIQVRTAYSQYGSESSPPTPYGSYGGDVNSEGGSR